MYSLVFIFLIMICGVYHLSFSSKLKVAEKDVELNMQDTIPEIVNGIHLETGFIAEGDFELIISNCTGCHSSKLVTQNKQTKEGWLELIRWMQKEQKLWDLGQNEEKILNYLSTYYAPKEEGRRKNLKIDDWYEIK
jgi:hypothetical protein